MTVSPICAIMLCSSTIKLVGGGEIVSMSVSTRNRKGVNLSMVKAKVNTATHTQSLVYRACGVLQLLLNSCASGMLLLHVPLPRVMLLMSIREPPYRALGANVLCRRFVTRA